jgi:nickel transport protein
MPDCSFRKLRAALVIAAVMGGAGLATPAMAHKVFVFASVQGRRIEGEVYFRGGTPARDAKVTVVGPGGEVLGETATDEEGKFVFEAQQRFDHRLLADAGGGHEAEYTVAADELPDELPAPGAPEASPTEAPEPAKPPSSESQDESPPAGSAEEPASMPGSQDLRAQIESVARQVGALRNDLDKFRNRQRLQDVLGGLGYILGIMGVVFYFLGVRRKERREAASQPTDLPDS